MTPEDVLNEVINVLSYSTIETILDEDNYDLTKGLFAYSNSKIPLNNVLVDKYPLGYCIKNNKLNSARALMDIGADMSSKDNHGCNAFEYAAQKPDKSLLKYMMQKYMFAGAVDESELIDETKAWALAYAEKENLEPKEI